MDLLPKTAGEVGGWVSVLSVAAIGLWTQFGKRGDTVFTRMDTERKLMTEERNRLTTKLTEAEKALQLSEDTHDKLKEEINFLKAGHRAMIDFLEDVCGGSYPLDWIKDRAGQLKQRFKL